MISKGFHYHHAYGISQHADKNPPRQIELYFLGSDRMCTYSVKHILSPYILTDARNNRMTWMEQYNKVISIILNAFLLRLLLEYEASSQSPYTNRLNCKRVK